MGEEPGQARAPQLTQDDAQKSAAQLRAEIEDVREDLGDTAAALAAKTDVKARAQERVDEVKHTAAQKKDDLLTKARERPAVVAAVGLVVGGLLLYRLSRRRSG